METISLKLLKEISKKNNIPLYSSKNCCVFGDGATELEENKAAYQKKSMILKMDDRYIREYIVYTPYVLKDYDVDMTSIRCIINMNDLAESNIVVSDIYGTNFKWQYSLREVLVRLQPDFVKFVYKLSEADPIEVINFVDHLSAADLLYLGCLTAEKHHISNQPETLSNGNYLRYKEIDADLMLYMLAELED